MKHQYNIHNGPPGSKVPRNKGIIIIGGGMSGLIASILLARRQLPVTVLEKKTYPFHRVCGEYISNETTPFLRNEGLYPVELSPVEISELELTSVSGKSVVVPLGLGGFGISRFAYDYFLYRKAVEAGVTFLLNQEAGEVSFDDDQFTVTTGEHTIAGDVVLGAFGKRSRVDHVMHRPFAGRRSPYAGVKYHVVLDQAAPRIALHNFSNGYCGVNTVEDGKVNICYLTHRDNLRAYRNIRSMEEAVLFKNPFIRNIFENARFLMDKPEVINEVTFATKSAVDNHVLMIGDAAGMIAPLCGNGMAMAIHSAKIASDYVSSFMKGEINRTALEDVYSRNWESLFSRRLWIGRQVQLLFGSQAASNVAVKLARSSPRVTRWVVAATHGPVF